MKNIQRVRVSGTLIDAIDMQGALAFVDDKVAARGAAGHVVAINPEKAYAVQRNRELREFVEDASLLIPDGIGVVLAARFLHGARIGRVPGADLAQAICSHSAEKGHRLFIYGASEDVNRDATAILRNRFPGIMIVGRSHGYVPQEEMAGLIDRINDSGADILFVALGSPKQRRVDAPLRPDAQSEPLSRHRRHARHDCRQRETSPEAVPETRPRMALPLAASTHPPPPPSRPPPLRLQRPPGKSPLTPAPPSERHPETCFPTVAPQVSCEP